MYQYARNPSNQTFNNFICRYPIQSCQNIRNDIEPDFSKTGYDDLNAPCTISPFFCPENTSSNDCANPVYVSNINDARIFDGARGILTKLDSVPLQTYYDLINDNVSLNPYLDGYGIGYRDYSQIKEGQVQYYVDKSLAQPFYDPVYAIPSQSIGYNWQDPMSSVKPQFLKSYPDTTKYSNLSAIDDTSKFREDIIARQQRTHNQRKYELVYDL